MSLGYPHCPAMYLASKFLLLLSLAVQHYCAANGAIFNKLTQ